MQVHYGWVKVSGESGISGSAEDSGIGGLRGGAEGVTTMPGGVWFPGTAEGCCCKGIWITGCAGSVSFGQKTKAESKVGEKHSSEISGVRGESGGESETGRPASSSSAANFSERKNGFSST